jgi:putative transposase
LLTDGGGIPLSITIDGANRHDVKMARKTLCNIVIERPQSTDDFIQHICMDKGYDSQEIRDLVKQWGYVAHIKVRGEEVEEKQKIPGYRARRWVTERTHSWLNRFRKILIRWEKKPENYIAFLCLACAIITFRASRLFG